MRGKGKKRMQRFRRKERQGKRASARDEGKGLHMTLHIEKGILWRRLIVPGLLCVTELKTRKSESCENILEVSPIQCSFFRWIGVWKRVEHPNEEFLSSIIAVKSPNDFLYSKAERNMLSINPTKPNRTDSSKAKLQPFLLNTILD